MSLQWFPGHMGKARRELAALMPSQDVLIEVLDARMPASSHNPLVTDLWGARPRIQVLTMSDLANPAVTNCVAPRARQRSAHRRRKRRRLRDRGDIRQARGDPRTNSGAVGSCRRPSGQAGARVDRGDSERGEVDPPQHPDEPNGRRS